MAERQPASQPGVRIPAEIGRHIGPGRQQGGVDALISRQLGDPGHDQGHGGPEVLRNLVGRRQVQLLRRAGARPRATASRTSCRHVGAQAAAVQAPHVVQRIVVGWRPVGDRLQGQIGQHRADGQVQDLGPPLPPRRHLLGHAARRAPQLPGVAELPPGPGQDRRAPVSGPAGPAHSSSRPLQAGRRTPARPRWRRPDPAGSPRRRRRTPAASRSGAGGASR